MFVSALHYYNEYALAINFTDLTLWMRHIFLPVEG
jgi:hypothetical protein